MIELLGDQEADDRIAEELQPLVVGVRVALLHGRRVGESAEHEILVPELVPENGLGELDSPRILGGRALWPADARHLRRLRRGRR